METEEEYKQRIRNDLQQAEARIEQELGPQLPLLAFPYGAYNDAAPFVWESWKIIFQQSTGKSCILRYCSFSFADEIRCVNIKKRNNINFI